MYRRCKGKLLRWFILTGLWGSWLLLMVAVYGQPLKLPVAHSAVGSMVKTNEYTTMHIDRDPFVCPVVGNNGGISSDNNPDGEVEVVATEVEKKYYFYSTDNTKPWPDPFQPLFPTSTSGSQIQQPALNVLEHGPTANLISCDGSVQNNLQQQLKLTSVYWENNIPKAEIIYNNNIYNVTETDMIEKFLVVKIDLATRQVILRHNQINYMICVNENTK